MCHTLRLKAAFRCKKNAFLPSTHPSFLHAAHINTNISRIPPPDTVLHWSMPLSHIPLYFSITQAPLSLHRRLSGASGCYRTPGNQRYSYMAQIGVNSYYSREGVEGKWKLTYQKGHSSDSHPPDLPLAFSICRPSVGYLFPPPFPSSPLHGPMISDQ